METTRKNASRFRFELPGVKRHPEIWILGFGLLVRILWVIAVPVQPVSDGVAYDTFARSVAAGDGYGWEPGQPGAYWPPGTAFVYAALYAIFGTNYTPIVLLNLLLYLILSGTTMALAARWFTRRVSLLAGMLLACWPLHVQFTTVLASELLFSTAIAAGWWLWSNEAIALRLRALLLGGVLGGAIYVRTTGLLLPALFACSRGVRTREVFHSGVAALLATIIALGLVAPWSYRNYQAFGEFVLVSTNSGPVFWMGNNPESTGSYMALPPEVEGMSETERSEFLKTIALEHVRERPLLFAWRSVVRLVKTHARETIGVAWNSAALEERYGSGSLLWFKVASQLYWLPVLGFAIAGALRLGRLTGWLAMATHPTVLTWGYFAGVHALVIAQDRYHFPSTPWIAVLAAYAIAGMLGRDRNQQPSATLEARHR